MCFNTEKLPYQQLSFSHGEAMDMIRTFTVVFPLLSGTKMPVVPLPDKG